MQWPEGGGCEIWEIEGGSRSSSGNQTSPVAWYLKVHFQANCSLFSIILFLTTVPLCCSLCDEVERVYRLGEAWGQSAEPSWHRLTIATHAHCYLGGWRGLRSWRLCERCNSYPCLEIGKVRVLKPGEIHMICAVYKLDRHRLVKPERQHNKQTDD